MKYLTKYLLVLVATLAVTCSMTFAADGEEDENVIKVAPGKIDSVEVYRTAAKIHRTVSVEFPEAGQHVVKVQGFPRSLDDRTIIIGGEGAADMKLEYFEYFKLPHDWAEHPEIKAAEERLRNVQLEIEEWKRMRSSAQARVDYLQSLAESIRDSLKKEPDTAVYALAKQSWQELEAARAEEVQVVLQVEERLPTLEERARQLDGELGRTKNRIEHSSGRLDLYVTVEEAGSVEFNLSYVCLDAEWDPFYELRADPSKGVVELVFKAEVYQRTGEDWDDVELILSTSVPMAEGEAPAMWPILLQTDSGYAKSLSTADDEDIFDLPASPVRSHGWGDQNRAYEQAETMATTSSFLARLPGRITLESYHNSGARELKTISMDAEFWTLTVPSKSTTAYLTALVIHSLNWPIIPGEAYLYVDGQMTGTSELEAHIPGDEFEIGFGRNEQVNVERMERVRKESEGGLIDKTQRHQRKYETVITNRMSVPHEIVVKEQIPVALNNKIQVKLEQPRDVKVEEGKGFFERRITLQPGASETLTTEFEVTWPAEWNVPVNF